MKEVLSMMIRISEMARELYRQNEGEDSFFAVEFDGTLEALEGRTVEVDTSRLRKNRFVILPIPGVCDDAVINAYAVDEVIDDIRPQAEALRVL